jgi:hypothetical protein
LAYLRADKHGPNLPLQFHRTDDFTIFPPGKDPGDYLAKKPFIKLDLKRAE